MFVGVDYGSKLAGTTVICYAENGQLCFLQSEKKKNADEMILSFIQSNNVDVVYLDAPLSLPKAYFGYSDDYFYREGDRALKAMSPMFLGGLTARAMKLKHQCKGQSDFHEVYPGALRKQLFPDFIGYKKQKELIGSFAELLENKLSQNWKILPKNWHQIDAALAWFSGYRHQQGLALSYGNKEEGLIWV